MATKTLSKKSPVEDRLLGIETRLTRIENKISDSHFDSIRISNRVIDMEKSLAKFEDSFSRMEDKFEQEFEKFRSKMITVIDPLFGHLKKFNEEQDIHAGQHQEVYEKVEKIQSTHPNFKHVFPTPASL